MFCFTNVISNFYEYININVFKSSINDDTKVDSDNLSCESSYNSVIIHDDIVEQSLFEKLLYAQNQNDTN
jgi:hypothetical protein